MRSYRLLLIVIAALVASPAAAQGEETFIYIKPDWSPDGKKIAFEGGLDGELSIYTIDLDGKNLTELTNKEYNDEGPVWSPDGNKIAFFSNRHERKDERPISLQIYIMNADGTGQRRITHDGPALEYNISWSPDGERLVFQSRPEINPGVHSLYVIGADGTGRQRITDGRFNDTTPQWSPDGKQILFVQSAAIYKFFADYTPEDRKLRRTSTEIMLLNLEDRTKTPITQNDVSDFDPSWNADGSEIYYLQEVGGERTLFRQKPGEREAVAVVDGDLVSNPGFVTRTRLSPDGRFVVYHKQIDDLSGIYIYGLETKHERLLVGGAPAE